MELCSSVPCCLSQKWSRSRFMGQHFLRGNSPTFVLWSNCPLYVSVFQFLTHKPCLLPLPWGRMPETTSIPWTRENLVLSWPEMWWSSSPFVLYCLSSGHFICCPTIISLYVFPTTEKAEWHFLPFHSPNWEQFTPVVTSFFLASRQVLYTECVLWTSDGQVPQCSGGTAETLDTILSFRGHPSLLTIKIGQKHSKNRPLSWGFGTSAPVWGQRCLKIWERRLKEILVLIGGET